MSNRKNESRSELLAALSAMHVKFDELSKAVGNVVIKLAVLSVELQRDEEASEPFREGDKFKLPDGTEVVISSTTQAEEPVGDKEEVISDQPNHVEPAPVLTPAEKRRQTLKNKAAKAGAKVHKEVADAVKGPRVIVNVVDTKKEERPKVPPGAPRVSMHDTIIGMIKAGTTITALQKMLDNAIKNAAPAVDIFELRQAIQRFNVYDGDRAELLAAYDDHSEEAGEILVGKSTSAELPAAMQERADEQAEDEPMEDAQEASGDPDDNF